MEWLYIIKEHANIMKFIIKMIYISMAYVYSRMLFAMYSVSKRALVSHTNKNNRWKKIA